MARKQKEMTGEALRKLRTAAGLTQVELAAAVGMTQTTISLHETGGRAIRRRDELAYRAAIAAEKAHA